MQSIAFILNSISGGGIARVVTSYANYLIKDGVEVHVITLHRMEHFYHLEEKIQLHENPCLRKESSKLKYTVKTFQFVRNTIKEISPEVIISNGEWINSFVYIATVGIKSKLLLADHSNPNIKLGFLHDRLKKFTYNRTVGVIVLSENAKNILSGKVDSEKIHVLPNPLNTVERKNIPVKDIIVSIGRMTTVKGHRYLIEAFHHTGLKDWKLSLVGEGPEMQGLKILAKKLRIDDQVLFHGKQSDIAHYLSEAKIFVLPSLSENFPMALTEAMSLPLACITTDCLSGNKQEAIIKNDINGLVVEPGNIEELSSAIKRLASDKTLQKELAHNAYKIRDQLSIDYNIIKLKNIILDN